MNNSKDSSIKTVLLFRAPKDAGKDPYEQLLLEEGFHACSIPVLDFKFVNIDTLKQSLQLHEDFSAIVFTSQRAVEATCLALTELGDDKNTEDEKRRRRCIELPCCVVGPSTRETAISAGFSPMGSDTGNADRLADYITTNLTEWKRKPILYPCGNLRKDTLSEKLKDAGFQLHEIEVYQTVKSEKLKEKVKELIKTQSMLDAVVYFSPSGVRFTSDLFDEDILSTETLKIIAIGHTTEKELKERGFTVHCVAETPDKQGVLSAILNVLPNRQ